MALSASSETVPVMDKLILHFKCERATILLTFTHVTVENNRALNALISGGEFMLKKPSLIGRQFTSLKNSRKVLSLINSSQLMRTTQQRSYKFSGNDDTFDRITRPRHDLLDIYLCYPLDENLVKTISTR
jgi:hypothetical protein